MTSPDLVENIEYDGKDVTVKWYDLVDKELPDLKWHQVYVIGDVDGLVPIVHYEDDHDNLPGGRAEPGETIEQTLIREMDEELKMEVLSWEPLGYQEWVEAGDMVGLFALRVYAKLVKNEEFINDPRGPVVGHTLIPLEELNDRINYHEIGDRIIELADTIRSRKK